MIKFAEYLKHAVLICTGWFFVCYKRDCLTARPAPTVFFTPYYLICFPDENIDKTSIFVDLCFTTGEFYKETKHPDMMT